MSAIIRCYNDYECTDPIFKNEISYDMQLGPRTGLDGDTGEVFNQSIFLRNEGDVAAFNVRIKEVGDLNDYFYMTTDIDTYSNTIANIPDMEPGDVQEVVLIAVIPKGTQNTKDYLEYTIEFLTPPRPIIEQATTDYVESSPKLYYSSYGKPANAPAGKPYGDGAYGNPLYGQEGLIHKRLEVVGDMPIAGIANTFVNASVTIASRYTGKEATIEDVQSYYTSRFMMLGCYDGPALPLWMEQTNEQNLV